MSTKKTLRAADSWCRSTCLCGTTTTAVSDRIGDVYDYDEAIGTVKRAVMAGHVNLLETLAERIAEGCLDNRIVSQVTVRIEKPDILPACRAVGIQISRRQKHR